MSTTINKFHLDRAPKLPINGDGTDADGKIGLDYYRVTRDEALELMVHHLKLAAMFYEAVSDDEAVVANEVARIMASGIPNYYTPAYTGALHWLHTMNKLYARLKTRQDNGE